jgi:hypothetical protein
MMMDNYESALLAETIIVTTGTGKCYYISDILKKTGKKWVSRG